MRDTGAAGHARQVLERLHCLAGADPANGVDRVVFTKGHLRERDRLIDWAVGAGLEPSVDPIGNLWLLPSEPAPGMLLMGSHLDSVPGGGKFDGALGLVLALELASNLGEGNRDRGKIAVVDFVAEESSRFGVGTVGSSVFAGRRKLDEGLALKDSKGVTFGDCRRGLWTDIATADSPPANFFSCYLEAHLDQATDLTSRSVSLGIVDSIAAPTRWRLGIRGVQSHAGAAAMNARRDALVAASQLVVWLEELAKEFENGEVRATVGQLDVRPNVPNVVPGSVDLIVDLRVLRSEHAQKFGALLRKKAAEIASARELRIEVGELLSDEPRSMDSNLTEILSAAAREVGVAAPRLPSWSAHDALQVSTLLPSSMILLRNRGEVSHSPLEDVSTEDVAAAYALFELAANRLCVGR